MNNVQLGLIKVLWGFTFLWASISMAQNYTLPLYELEIDVDYLQTLNNNPWTSNTFPATVKFEDEVYNCEVRYRGASARNLPKKSWKLFFDNSSPLNRKVINLNSEYRDISLNHNHLTLQLARSIGLPAPVTRHVSLSVNGVYFGVYLEIENIDKQFFESRENLALELYKSRTHASRFAPPLNPFDLPIIYEPKFLTQGSLDTLGKRLSFFQYSPPGSNTHELVRIVDVDNLIKYFALMYAVCGWDGFDKNFYLWRRDDNRYLLIPWDCDATFGNDWLGNFVGFESIKTFTPLLEQSLFQHLIAVPEYRRRLHVMIEFIVGEGFQIAERILSDTYDLIRHDVYLDTLMLGDMESFDVDQQNFHDFIEGRRRNLQGLDWFYRFDVSEVTFTPEYADNRDAICNFQVRLGDVPHRAMVTIIDSANAEVRVLLNDLGENGDQIAGDLIYSTEFSFSDYTLPISLGISIESRPQDYFTHPPSGWHLLGRKRFPLPKINLNNDPPIAGDLSFGDPATEHAGTFIIPLTNISQTTKEISSCQISLGSGYQRQLLPQLDPLEPRQTLFITNHLEQAEFFFPEEQFSSGFYFAPNIGDTLRLISPGGNLLAEKVISNIELFSEIPSGVVINEINFQSSDEFDTGDWIELFTLQRNIDLSGWKLTDSDPTHVFTFPLETNLPPNSFLVIARDPDNFNMIVSDTTNVIGGFDFGFARESDDVKIYDELGKVVDWVSYSSSDPWPDIEKKGGTFELLNPRFANYSSENWHVSGPGFPLGTPGYANSLFHFDSDRNVSLLAADYQLVSAWPNPFNDVLYVSFTAPEIGSASFILYNSLGRQVLNFSEVINRAGYYRTNIELSKYSIASLSAGSYFLRMKGIAADSYLQIIYLP